MLSESALEDFSDTPQEDPNAVVIGLAPEKFIYENMSLAFRLIKEQGAPLIAIHKARYMMTKSGLAVGPGKDSGLMALIFAIFAFRMFCQWIGI